MCSLDLAAPLDQAQGEENGSSDNEADQPESSLRSQRSCENHAATGGRPIDDCPRWRGDLEYGKEQDELAAKQRRRSKESRKGVGHPRQEDVTQGKGDETLVEQIGREKFV
jgi:hypothetical protein